MNRDAAQLLIRVPMTVNELPAAWFIDVVRDEQDRPILLHHLARGYHEAARRLEHIPERIRAEALTSASAHEGRPNGSRQKQRWVIARAVGKSTRIDHEP